MQIVFLSGGSGKRLWPLSNNARSKQFLPLLEREDGSMESMVQRVVRQVRESKLDAEITLATNETQRDSIINQLGESVSIVTEPERRDTFPAIALAAAYLKLQKQCLEDEVVVVMPSDPYTELGYFDTIRQMVHEVEMGTADLLLMGITPTYPSAKYGYIVPAESIGTKAKMVARFTEKPSVSVARQLLIDGALWNGGVFAFRLGYMMRMVEQYIQADNFASIRARYAEFPKISFDYEVAEKAMSVAVVAYTGQWKDLGTWNTLTDELHYDSIGNVIMGEKNVNTHVINELGIPVFCEGMTDTVVAACPDGIMVCAKRETENIKHYVDSLNARPMYEERRWGTYQVLNDVEYADGTRSLTKTITLNAGKNISYQVHHHREEVWTIVDGVGQFVLDGQLREVKRGDVLHIKIGQLHAIRAITSLTLIEVQIGNPLIEEDIERFEWQW